MKIVRKTLLAAAITAALAPAAAMADTTLFGNFDVGFAVETAAEEAFVVYDSPAVDNVIGIEGELEMENGNAITYQYVFNVDLDNDNGAASRAGNGNSFGTNYHSYVGYKTDMFEVRLGNQDLPLRLALEKSDLFQGTYADQNNAIGASAVGGFGVGNSTAPNSVMVLGGDDSLKYAVSLDNAGDAENANAKYGSTATRYGAMVDVALNDNMSVSAGVEARTNTFTAGGIAADIGLSDSLRVTVGINSIDNSGGNDVLEATAGVAFGLSDMTTLKFQAGTREVDITGQDAQPANYYAIGADFEMSDNVTTYVLAAAGKNSGLRTVEADTAGDGSVFATGVKLSF